MDEFKNVSLKGQIPSSGHACYELIRNLRKAQPRAKDSSPWQQRREEQVILFCYFTCTKMGNKKQ